MNRILSQFAIALMVLMGVLVLWSWHWQLLWMANTLSTVLWIVLALRLFLQVYLENSEQEGREGDDYFEETASYRLKSLLNSGTVMILSCQPEEPYKVTFINDNAASLFGYTAQQFLKETNFWIDRVAPEDTGQVANWLPQLQNHGIHQHEYRFLHADGTYHWMRTHLKLIRDPAGNPMEMVGCVIDVHDLHQSEEIFRQQAERERLIMAITQRIRQSLDLKYVLQTTVDEVQQLLKADRVLIYQFQPDWSGMVTVEAISASEFSIIGETIHDDCFKGPLLEPYQQGQIAAIENIYSSGKQPCHIELLARYQVKANLVLPILQGLRESEGDSTDSPSSGATKLWGLLLAHQCTAPRQWQAWEISLLQQIAVQVGIATQQSQLYEQTQQQAQQAQALNRVIQAIRNSLELDSIFSTAVAEITHLLKVDRAIIAQYEPQQNHWRNLAEFCKTPDQHPPLPGTIADEGNDIAARLKRLEVIRMDESQAMLIPGAWLMVPLVVGVQIWGSLSLVKHTLPTPWQDSDVALATAVTDQLAIAIQQSELYQQLQTANSKLEQLVAVDDLTQIANRRRLDQHLHQEWYRLAREQACLSLILCDVDYFKSYNDTYGHLAGDNCLWQVAQAISRTVKRPADLVARYGGEEFAVILPNTDTTGAIQVAQAIQVEIQQLQIEHGASSVNPCITLSYGIATTFPDLSVPPQALLDQADQALYLAKANGRNGYVVA